MLVLKDRDGHPIRDGRDWTRPKKASQWKPGRSAMALAQAWFPGPGPVCPREVRELLASRPETAGVALTEGWPEYVTPLPERGEGRNHDLLLVGENAGRAVVVSVEAKVDEPFGDRIGDYWRSARQSRTPTRAPERIQALLRLVFGPDARPDAEPWAPLRYQLLTMIAGTAIEAKRREAPEAIALIHEFRTTSASPEKLETNSRDFDAFMSVLLAPGNVRVTPGQLHGPVVLKGEPHLPHPITLYVGKAISQG
ncbi:MAG: DUF6946 family protein [Bacillota bacterium]